MIGPTNRPETSVKKKTLRKTHKTQHNISTAVEAWSYISFHMFEFLARICWSK